MEHPVLYGVKMAGLRLSVGVRPSVVRSRSSSSRAKM